MIIHGRNIIEKLADEFSLPYWWTESVVVEYLPCRRYGENGEFYTFDFEKLSENDIEQIPEKKVIIPNYSLVQNIRPKDLSERILMSMAGLPFIPLEDANFVPEGLVNNSAFPSPLRNDIDVSDPKLGFACNAIVREDSSFYQWIIAENLKLEGKHYHWYKSNIMDLSKLFLLNEEERKLINSSEMKNPDSCFIAKIEKLYQEIEKARIPLREEIFGYHNKRKSEFDVSKAEVPKVPLLSYFESIRLTENGYQIKTHTEPLFLRAAIRNLLKAQDAKAKRGTNRNDHYTILDEIEYSSMCIIAATNCLESYINYVISRYLPDESKIFDGTASHRQKWLFVPAALDLPFRFKPDEEPFSGFSQLVKWRNNTIHHKAEFVKVRGSVSHTYNQLNVESARSSIKTVRDMVTKLSEGEKIPLPIWIKTSMGSAPGYWDEVSKYLKSIDDS